jgi:hypothetical protein
MLLWGVASFNWAPPELWLDAAAEESFKLQPHMGPQEVANVVWAFARLGTWPQQVGLFFTHPKKE